MDQIVKIRVFPLSHSVWSAWIEIGVTEALLGMSFGRTPYGVRELKSFCRHFRSVFQFLMKLFVMKVFPMLVYCSGTLAGNILLVTDRRGIILRLIPAIVTLIYRQNVGYFLCLIRLLYSKATHTIIIEPINTGVKRKDQELAAVITTIGFAPAGGCVVLLTIIKAIPNPTAKDIAQIP
jgi:hypothetical protein